MPDESEFLCGNWVWDAALRELRYFRRRRKGHEEEPEFAEQLKPVRAVTWHRWSQQPMGTPTGETMPGNLSRVVVEYEGGGDLTVNEADRECAGKIAQAIAQAYGLAVIEAGAPSGRRGGNLPPRDSMGRLAYRDSRLQVGLDEAGGEITVAKSKRPFGKSRRSFRTSEVRRLELVYEVKGPTETFTLWAVVGVEEEKVPLAAYSGYEGWADPGEWREFAREVGRSLGVEAVV